MSLVAGESAPCRFAANRTFELVEIPQARSFPVAEYLEVLFPYNGRAVCEVMNRAHRAAGKGDRYKQVVVVVAPRAIDRSNDRGRRWAERHTGITSSLPSGRLRR